MTVNAKGGQTSESNSTTVTASSANHASVTSSAVTTTLNVAPVLFSVGPNNPTSGVNNASIGTVAWSNPNNVRAADNIYATVSVGKNVISNYLTASGMNFAIPAGATIKGIEVTVERKEGSSSTMGIKDNSVRLLKNNTVTGTEHAGTTAWGSAETIVTYGSQTDLWGVPGHLPTSTRPISELLFQ